MEFASNDGGTPSAALGDAQAAKTTAAISDRVTYAICAVALAAAISIWFVAVRAPLWLDETISFYTIKKGFWEVLPRQGWPGVPAYYYILWLWTKIAGTRELVLRISSILAMLAAVYLLFRAARELFDTEIAFITATLFCIHPIVIFESIDVRPYTFESLATAAAILALVRLRSNGSNWLAALFGLSAAFIVYFHFLGGAILPALALCFLVVKIGDRKNFWRQMTVALIVFSLAFVLVIPGLLYMLRTRGNHVFDDPPPFRELAWTFAPGWWIFILGGALLLAAATRKIDLSTRVDGRRLLLCVLLGFVPILILYGVSVGTPLHIFVFRYRLVALPGIALCWGWVLNRIDSRLIRLLFCLGVVFVTAHQYYGSPMYKFHEYTWKYALEIAEKSTSPDNAPVIICSDLVESNFVPMPVGAQVEDSPLFSELSYYKLSVPVVPLPRALNEQAMRAGWDFVQAASARRQRFLAMAYTPSYDTMHWLTNIASPTYDVHVLAQTTGVVVLEFTPRPEQPAHLP